MRFSKDEDSPYLISIENIPSEPVTGAPSLLLNVSDDGTGVQFIEVWCDSIPDWDSREMFYLFQAIENGNTDQYSEVINSFWVM